MFTSNIFTDEISYIEDFIFLPKKLYTQKNITQNESLERDIFSRKHCLNIYFNQYPFVVYNEKKEVSGRAIVTIYHNSDVAYIGYFECINDLECAKKIFDTAEEIVRKQGISRIIGPVDSSFWIKYRLKVDNFDKKIYTGEPYNLEYYADFFEKNGYGVLEKYVSRKTKRAIGYLNKKNVYIDRFKSMQKSGYYIRSPKPKEFNETLEILYDMIIELYASFPIFYKITKQEFLKIFEDYKYIIDYKIVKVVYFNNEPVGFYVGLPDYNNLLYRKRNIFNIINILLRRIRSDNYVMLYMGAKPEHLGLGKALIGANMYELSIKMSTAIGALMGEGKKSKAFMHGDITNEYSYYLYEKNI